MGKSTSVNNPSTARGEDYLKKYEDVSSISSGFIKDDSSIDANSEKELVWIVVLEIYIIGP